MPRHVTFALALVTLLGCQSATRFDPDGTTNDRIPSTCSEGTQMTLDLAPPNAKVDILVVMDNSRSMAEEQEALADVFPDLMASLLDPLPDPVTGVPRHVPLTDLHVGVVSTDMGSGGYLVETCAESVSGDDGTLQHTPSETVSGCDPSYDRWLEQSGPASPSDVEWLGTAFGCIATLGTTGCGLEQQLRSAQRAIEQSGSGGANHGFLREDSILVLLWVTDEGDCSVTQDASGYGLFDLTDDTLGPINTRCYFHEDRLEDVQTFIDDFRETRPGMPERLLLAFVVGVPPGTACEGRGDDIAGCLAHPQMQPEPDPADPGRMRPSCETPSGAAYPATRSVQLALSFGDQAIVQSICTEDFSPVVDDLSALLHERIDGEPLDTALPVVPDPDDPCGCEADCRLLEVFPDDRPCPAGHPCFDPNGAGCWSLEDEEGGVHTVCELPQAGTAIVGCDPDVPATQLDCDDPAARHMSAGDGWSYHPDALPHPSIVFGGDLAPDPDSTLHLSCCM